MYGIAVDVFVCIPHAHFVCVCKVVKIMQLLIFVMWLIVYFVYVLFHYGKQCLLYIYHEPLGNNVTPPASLTMTSPAATSQQWMP